MSELTLQECQAIQHLWKDRDFQVGDWGWYKNERYLIVEVYANGIEVMVRLENFGDKNIKNRELILQADTKLMLEALPDKIDKDIYYFLRISRGHNRWYVFYANDNKFQPNYKETYGSYVEFKNADIDKALQQMHVYLKDNGLMEA